MRKWSICFEDKCGHGCGSMMSICKNTQGPGLVSNYWKKKSNWVSHKHGMYVPDSPDAKHKQLKHKQLKQLKEGNA